MATKSNSLTKNEPNVRVFVRIRPLSVQEKNCPTRECLIAQENTILVDIKPTPKQFTFDWVAGPDITQEAIFEKVGQPIAESCLAGYNGTIFAYGQTGSGKTFTIQGALDGNGKLVHEQRGLMPRLFDYLFAQIEKRKRNGNTEYVCKCSYLEIYNDQITDLLNPEATRLQLRDDQKKGVYVENLTEQIVEDAESTIEILSLGSQNRHVGSTAANEQSSRSHSVFTLYIKSTEQNEGLARTKFSHLHLIDLAGSERQKSTLSSGAQLKEASHINNTLTTLGKVIRRLVDVSQSGKAHHVSYRESKLTFLLKDSLGGNSKTSIVATVCSSGRYFGETLSTLKFSQRAKLIKNKAIINEDAPSGSIFELQQELRKKEAQLAAYKNMPPGECLEGEVNTRQSAPDPDRLEIEELLRKSLERIALLEESKKKLSTKIEKLLSFSEKQESFLQARKMITKLQEEKIKRLDKGQDNPDDTIKELKEQINILNWCMEHHPTIIKFAIENGELRELIERYQMLYEEDMKAYNSELLSLRQLFADLSSRHQKLIKQKHQLLQIISQSSSSSTETMWDTDEKLEQTQLELDRIKAELLETKQTIGTLKSTLSREQEQNAALEKALDDAQTEYQSEIAAMKAKQTQLDASFAIQQDDKAQLNILGNTQLSEITVALQRQVTSLRSENDNLRAKLEEERDTLRRTRVTLSTAEGENRRLSACFAIRDELMEQNKLLEQQLLFLEESKHKLEAENCVFRDELAKKNSNNILTEMEHQLTSEKLKNDRLLEEQTSLKEENEQLQEERDFRCNQATAFERTIEENKVEIFSLKEDVEKWKNNFSVAQGMLGKVEEEGKKREREVLVQLEEMERKIEEGKILVKKLETELETTKLELSTTQATMQLVTNENETMKLLLAEARGHLEEKKHLAQELSSLLEDQAEDLKSNHHLSHMEAIPSDRSEILHQSNAFQETLSAQAAHFERDVGQVREERTVCTEKSDTETEGHVLYQQQQAEGRSDGIVWGQLRLMALEGQLDLYGVKENQWLAEKERTTQEQQKLVDTLEGQNAKLKSVAETMLQLKSKCESLEQLNYQAQSRIKEHENTINLLEAQNQKLVGHGNAKQKIQHYVQVKKENNILKAEKEQLQKELSRKEQLIKKMSTDTKKIRPLREEENQLLEKIHELYHLTRSKELSSCSLVPEDPVKCLVTIGDTLRQSLFQTELNQKELNLLRKERFLFDKHKLSSDTPVDPENKENVL